MPNRWLHLDDALCQYVMDRSVREHPAQVALRASRGSHPHAGMHISPDQAQFMALLVKLLGARRAIEIGVFTGYSALAVTLALPDDGRLLACHISDDYTRSGRPALCNASQRCNSATCSDSSSTNSCANARTSGSCVDSRMPR